MILTVEVVGEALSYTISGSANWENFFRKYLSKLKVYVLFDQQNPLLLNYIIDMTTKLCYFYS